LEEIMATKEFKHPTTEVKVGANQTSTIQEILRKLKDPNTGKAMIDGVELAYAPCNQMVKIITHQDSAAMVRTALQDGTLIKSQYPEINLVDIYQLD
jgi:hypothetical protein